MSDHAPGAWPREHNYKRITIGYGLVEGPNGYEVAEVYADDCPREVAEAKARLIAAAPDLLAALERLRVAVTTRALRGRDHVPSMREEQSAVGVALAAIMRATGAEV